MPNFLKSLRRLPVKENLKDITVFINRELLPFITDLENTTTVTNEDNDDSFDSLISPEYIVKSADATLTNERVADDSTEIDLNYSVAGAVSWFLKTASVAFSKMSDLSALSVLGRASNTSGVMADITATAASQRLITDATGTQVLWQTLGGAEHEVTLTGTLTDYVLPTAMIPGDTLACTITGNVILNSIVPPLGVSTNFWFFLALRDQSGGNFSLTIPDVGTFVTGKSFRTPGQPFGGAAVDYVMQSEEEGCVISYSSGASNGIWRILAGTAAQAIAGDITVAAGNGATRTAAITAGVIVDADVNASAAIAQTKLGATSGFSVKASGASATTSAEPIVTYSASANMSAERVTTSSTSVTVSTSVASQIEFQRAALSGAIVATANANTTVFAGIRTNGSATTDRTNLNFLNTTTVNLTCTDDSGNDEIEITADLNNAVVTPAKLAVITSNIGATFAIYVAFAAGGGGSADDVTIYSASAPFAFRVLKTFVYISTAIAGKSVQVRSATAGGGTAISSLFAADVATEDPIITTSITATTTVAANGSAFIRRSDNGLAGEVILHCIRT